MEICNYSIWFVLITCQWWTKTSAHFLYLYIQRWSYNCSYFFFINQKHPIPLLNYNMHPNELNCIYFYQLGGGILSRYRWLLYQDVALMVNKYVSRDVSLRSCSIATRRSCTAPIPSPTPPHPGKESSPGGPHKDIASFLIGHNCLWLSTGASAMPSTVRFDLPPWWSILSGPDMVAQDTCSFQIY